jgi:hypothetical protein
VKSPKQGQDPRDPLGKKPKDTQDPEAGE